MKKLTPVLVVESIEPSLPFWCERLGFTKTAEVPHGDRLGFVMLNHGAVEVMLQTRASVVDDIGAHVKSSERATLERETHHASLFIEVEDLDATVRALGDWPLLFAERTTFYGAREIGVRDPAGNVVVLAQFGASS